MKSTKGRKSWRHMGAHLSEVVESLRKDHGFVEASVLLAWRTVVGDFLAKFTRPDKLRRTRHGHTLVVRAEAGMGVELQHLAPRILERLQQKCGHLGIVRIKVVHGQVKALPLDSMANSTGAPRPNKPRLNKPRPDTPPPPHGASAHPAPVAVLPAPQGIKSQPLSEALARFQSHISRA